MATRIYKTPFAATGDKEALATADQPDGKVSLQAGWTPDYELASDNPNYRPVGRAEMNGIIGEITEGLGEVQLNGFAKWQAIDGGWPAGAQVMVGDVVYRSDIASNVTTPGAVGASWTPMAAGIASTAEAEAGTNDIKTMTPLKVFQAIAKKVVQATETVLGIAKVATQAQTNAGTDDATIVTPKKLRWGFSILLASAGGYIAFPSWMGGLIIQWITDATTLAGGTGRSITLPLAFPNNVFSYVVSARNGSVAGAGVMSAVTLGNTGVSVYNNGSVAVAGAQVFLIGN